MGALGSLMLVKAAATASTDDAALVEVRSQLQTAANAIGTGFLSPEKIESIAASYIQKLPSQIAKYSPEVQQQIYALINEAMQPNGLLGTAISKKAPDLLPKLQAQVQKVTPAPAPVPQGQSQPAKPAPKPASTKPAPQTTGAPKKEESAQPQQNQQQFDLGNMLQTWAASEMGQKILGIIGPLIGQPNLAQMLSGKPSNAAPDVPVVNKPGSVSRSSSAPTPEKLTQDVRSAPDSVAGMRPVHPGANAYDRTGNQYHVSEDNRVWRLTTDPTSGAQTWTPMPNMNGGQLPEGETWETRKQQWIDYETNQLVRSDRYKQLYEKDPAKAKVWLEQQTKRVDPKTGLTAVQQRAMNRINEERGLGKDAAGVGLTQFTPSKNKTYIGQSGDPNSPGVALHEDDGTGNLKRYEGGVWTAGDAGSQARMADRMALQGALKERAKERQARYQDPAYVAKTLKSYKITGTKPPDSLVQAMEKDPEFAAQVAAHQAVEALADDPKNRGAAFNRAEQYQIALQSERNRRGLQGPPKQFRKPGDPLPSTTTQATAVAKKPLPRSGSEAMTQQTEAAKRQAAQEPMRGGKPTSPAAEAQAQREAIAVSAGAGQTEQLKEAPAKDVAAEALKTTPVPEKDLKFGDKDMEAKNSAPPASPSDPVGIGDQHGPVRTAEGFKADPRDAQRRQEVLGNEVARSKTDTTAAINKLKTTSEPKLGHLLLKAASLPEPQLLRTKTAAAKARAAEILGTKVAAEQTKPASTPPTAAAAKPPGPPPVKAPVRGSVKQTGPAPRMKGTQKPMPTASKRVTGPNTKAPVQRSKPQGFANPTSGVNAARVDTRNPNTREATPGIIGGGGLGAAAMRGRTDSVANSQKSSQHLRESGMGAEVHPGATQRNWGSPGLGGLAMGGGYDVDRSPGAKGRYLRHNDRGAVVKQRRYRPNI